MRARSTPSTRIGDVERAQAQRALQIHLDSGRLQVAEFVERFSRVADAATAGELAAVFADLPAPRPPLPRAPRDGPRRTLAVVGALALLALGGVLGFAIGRGQAGPVPPGVVAAPPDTVPPFGPLTSPAGPGGSEVPDSVAVRRSTGPGLITLRPASGVDLDDLVSPGWNAGSECCGRDVGFAPDGSGLATAIGHAVVTGPPEFATCFHETAYTGASLELADLRPGTSICVRTTEHRLGLVTIVDASEQAVEFGATVWDPQVPW